jgi:high affinity choline transporter 7
LTSDSRIRGVPATTDASPSSNSHPGLTIGVTIALLVTMVALAWDAPHPQWGGLAAMTLFYAAIYLLGLWATTHHQDGSFTDMVLAGRRLGVGIGVFTMTATWVDGGYINGTAEQTWSSGLLAVQAPWCYALSLFIGGWFFAPVMRRHRYTTLLDPFAQRYGHRAAALLYLPALAGEVFWTGAILTALGTTFGIILDLDFTGSIVVSAAVVTIYTVTGGMWAVAITDVAQLVVLIGGLWIVVPFVSAGVGGFDHAWTTYQARVAGAAPVNWWAWTDTAALLTFGGIPWHVYFQRVLAARDEQTARRLSILAGLVCLVAAVPPALLGILASGADWAARGISEPLPAHVLPVLLRNFTPPLVAALGLGAVSAAVMSSVDASVLSASSMAAWNVYRPLLRPDATARDLARIVRRLIVIVAVAATLIALRVQSIYALWVLCSDLVYCVLFPQLSLTLFDRRATRYGSYAGMTVSFVLRIGAGEPLLGLPALWPLPLDAAGLPTIPVKTIAMVAGLVTMAVVSRATSRWSPPVPLRPAES